jgi:hypothetical protein
MTEEYSENLNTLKIAVLTPLPASTLTLALGQNGQVSQPSLVEAGAALQDGGLRTGAPLSGNSTSGVPLRQRRTELSLSPVDRGYGAWSFVSSHYLVLLKMRLLKVSPSCSWLLRFW